MGGCVDQKRQIGVWETRVRACVVGGGGRRGAGRRGGARRPRSVRRRRAGRSARPRRSPPQHLGCRTLPHARTVPIRPIGVVSERGRGRQQARGEARVAVVFWRGRPIGAAARQTPSRRHPAVAPPTPARRLQAWHPHSRARVGGGAWATAASGATHLGGEEKERRCEAKFTLASFFGFGGEARLFPKKIGAHSTQLPPNPTPHTRLCVAAERRTAPTVCLPLARALSAHP